MRSTATTSRVYKLLSIALMGIFLCGGCSHCYYGNGSIIKGRWAAPCNDCGSYGGGQCGGCARNAWGPRYDAIESSCGGCGDCGDCGVVARPVGVCGSCRGVGPCNRCRPIRGIVAGSMSLVGALLTPEKWYGNCQGCGEKYWGDCISEPPIYCDPCDKQGNYIGPQACVRRRITLRCTGPECDAPLCGSNTGGRCNDCQATIEQRGIFGGSIQTVGYTKTMPYQSDRVYAPTGTSHGRSNCNSCNR